MAKNSSTRPDIQVLEDRVVKIKSQVEAFQGLRLYSGSKERLRKVTAELIQCTNILQAATGPATPNTCNDVTSSIVDCNQYKYNSGEVSEFSVDDDDDLSDSLDIDILQSVNNSSSVHYTSKYIVGSYSHRFRKCSFDLGCSSGIIQVNQFIQLLNTWYQTRFTPVDCRRNPKFLFKADKIFEWVNAFMLAAGDALHEDTFQHFYSEVKEWINLLNTEKDPLWAIPYNVKLATSNECTLEAVLLEKMIKPSLYDKSFYLHDMHTIENTYLNIFNVNSADLQINNLINSCTPKLIITSSFDINRYEVSD